MKWSFIPSNFPREWKKWDTNSMPQSKVTCPGALCLENMWVRKSFASWGELMVLWVGMNRDCLVSLLMITSIAVNPSDVGNCSMKSIEMESHSWFRMGSCFSRPYSLWQGGLDLAQLVHYLKKSITV